MAEFKLEGRTYVISRELLEPIIPKLSESRLVVLLEDLGRLEAAKEVGVMVCSDEAWDELTKLGESYFSEIRWRRFFRSCGINLEVR